MDFLNNLIGTSGEEILWWQMCIRALAVFAVAILLLHVSNKRIFGKHSSFDIILGIVLGSILGRNITGDAPFLASIAACFVLVLMHRLLSMLAFKSSIGKMFKGDSTQLVRNGEINWKKMKQNQITENDLMEAVRLSGALHFKNVHAAFLERSGDISIIESEENG